jgi:hypothetical protein
MNQKVYVVTRGRYSDCSNFGVYSTRERAEAAGGEIEEWILDNDPQRPGHFKCFHVVMDRDGNVWRANVTEYLGEHPKPSRRGKRQEHPGSYDFEVFGTDLEHAVKVVNEQRIQMIAENQWV